MRERLLLFVQKKKMIRNWPACLGLILLLLGSIIHALFGFSYKDRSAHAWGSDDAYISYRYAQNFSQGQGLVFNPGERVEGFSNLLYVILIACGSLLLPANSIYCFSLVLNMLFAGAAFLLFYYYVKSHLPPRQVLPVSLLFGLCPCLWVWTASGLETPMVLFVQIAIWFCVSTLVEKETSRKIVWLCIACILSIFVRADGFIMPGIAILYLWLMGRRKAALWCAATVILSMSLLVTFRYLYYGYPLPNTFYAKVDSSLKDRLSGAWVQFKNILFEKGLFLYLLTFIAGAIWALIRMIFRKPSLSTASGFSLFFVFFWLAYWFYVGGDVFFDRFLIILFPLGIIFCWESIQSWTTNRVVYILAFAVLLSWQLSPVFRDDRFKYVYPKYDMWVDLGKFIGERYQGKVLAAGGVGKIPFYSNLTTIDMLGLCDEKIGHEKVKKFIVGHSKFDPEYVLSRKPDLIALWIDHRMNYEFWFPPKQSEAYGYRLKYLVYADNHSCGKDIIEADSFTDSQIRNLWSKGYRYAVLEKVVSENNKNPGGILASYCQFRWMKIFSSGDLPDAVHKFNASDHLVQ